MVCVLEAGFEGGLVFAQEGFGLTVAVVTIGALVGATVVEVAGPVAVFVGFAFRLVDEFHCLEL
jgi:hypothetical protein